MRAVLRGGRVIPLRAPLRLVLALLLVAVPALLLSTRESYFDGLAFFVGDSPSSSSSELRTGRESGTLRVFLDKNQNSM